MTGEGGEVSVRRARRWPRVLGVIALLLGLVLLGLWLARKPLATRYADRFLAEKGVPARYGIADLGLGRQRLVNVVLGDPTDPDLVADWLEARTAIGLRGPYLTGVRGGHVRLRARWQDGRLSFGSVDRLIPAGPPGKPFALPALDVDVEDARLRLETPYGVAGVQIAGSGRLDGGFDGRLALASARLGKGDCAAERVEAAMRVAIARRASGTTIKLTGPARAAAGLCAGVRVAAPRSDLDVALVTGERLTWGVTGRLATGPATYRDGRAASLAGDVSLDSEGSYKIPMHASASGRPAATVDLSARAIVWRNLRAPFANLNATWRKVGRGGQLVADLNVEDADARAVVPRLGHAGAGTPVDPLVSRVAEAGRRAAARFTVRTGLILDHGDGAARLRIDTAHVEAASGAYIRVTDGPGIDWRAGAGLLVNGAVEAGGGGLPTIAARLTQAAPGAVQGTVTMRPYAADGAEMALTPVVVAADRTGWRVRTTATVSGPLGDGRVDGLAMPIDARWSGGRVTLGPNCAPLTWRRLTVSGLALDPASLRLCPTGPALVSVERGRVGGGASVDTARLTGRLGTTPLTLAVAGARVRLAEQGFAMEGVQARLGQPGRATRLDIASLEGRVSDASVAGRFAGAGGQIGAVPLLLSDAAGRWRVQGGALALDGALTVSDAQVDRPRFKPMPVREVALTLAGDAIAADGVVVAPGESGRKVADVHLAHRLDTSAGAATFTVPGLLFDKALQPDQLTPLTFGVIADVKGNVTGQGRIDWSDRGVTSTGAFHTAGTDLAAAFGPVQGIAGEIRFTDLLALQSAPGQRFTIRSVNPGIAVTDGVVMLQALPNTRVRVEGARWPFAGGTLTLDPTLLDFGQAAERRMTFRIAGMAADRFLQQFDFKNLDATGTFDGVLPMVFDASGGRIAGGHLDVRPGGGTIAYVGPLSQKDIGFWPNIAFQALKSLRYRSLGITMDGPLAGEMVTAVRFTGVTQGQGASKGGIAGLLVRRLQRLPFVFNIRIRAPFRGLLDSAASFYDPKRLVGRNLPLLLQQQRQAQPIQPPASETKP